MAFFQTKRRIQLLYMIAFEPKKKNIGASSEHKALPVSLQSKSETSKKDMWNGRKPKKKNKRERHIELVSCSSC